MLLCKRQRALAAALGCCQGQGWL